MQTRNKRETKERRTMRNFQFYLAGKILCVLANHNKKLCLHAVRQELGGEIKGEDFDAAVDFLLDKGIVTYNRGLRILSC
jgi:hypothetical protein